MRMSTIEKESRETSNLFIYTKKKMFTNNFCPYKYRIRIKKIQKKK